MRRNRDGSWRQFEDQTSLIIQIECLREWIPQTTNSMIPAVIPIPDTLVNYGNNNSNHIVGLCWWRSSPQKALWPRGSFVQDPHAAGVACWLQAIWADFHLPWLKYQAAEIWQIWNGLQTLPCFFFFPKDRVVPDWSDFMIHFCHVNLADSTRDQMIFLNRVENQISSNIYFKIPLGIPTGVHVSRGIPTGIFQINIWW